ncbi:RNA-binding protein pno1-like [Corticium candelabrum]|uniref:RNA-binding protein pno1-like n=1 Tax=Corticium candelabrum TaxID=121492 RepID=UPI002E2547E3|nr:RNA-binding protein pno1-like [Corticium candelabrum]
MEESEAMRVVTRKRRKDPEVAMEASESASSAKRPQYPPVDVSKTTNSKSEFRRITVPPHRFSPLKESWMKIFTPVVEHLKLQIRLNLKTKNVELKTSEVTTDPSALQKGADFVKAFMLGFEVDDSLALVRLDDLYLDSFEIQDVKPLKGEHLSRAIGRIAGSGGKTKFTIENVTKTRIVLADSKIHILGAFQNIKIARRAVCSLILGSPPSKVYGAMRTVASRSSERF